ncbi:putative synaptotagmin-2 [Sesbania bispinosa]|nr:putative synaptotagmin-2 [Sesbania bispinosa]
MGFFGTIFGFFGFGIGISIGLVVGYFLFIYFQPTDVKDPEIRPLADEDSETLQRMIPEIPLWIKIRTSIGIALLFVCAFLKVDWLNKLIEYMWPYLDKAICKTAQTLQNP